MSGHAGRDTGRRPFAFRVTFAVPRGLAVLFALFGSLAVLLLASIMPPFMNPDEGAHFTRADQIAHGGLVAHGGAAAPALIDSNVIDESRRFSVLAGDHVSRLSRALYAPAGWGPRVTQGYPNTAMYPPTLYLPAALAISIGQQAGLTMLPTLELARAATGMASVAIGAVAIAMAGPAAVWLFAILTLPMTLAEMGAVSQDGPMIALAALATALTMRLRVPEWRRRAVCFAGLCVTLALIGMARPPYVALAALALLARAVPRIWRWSGAILIVALVVGWSVLSLARTGTDLTHYAGADAGAQLAGLLHAPWRVVPIGLNTLAADANNYVREFVGQLGALDISLPGRYHLAALAILLLAGASAWRAGLGLFGWRMSAWVAGAVTAAVMLMFAVQYLTWTPVGAAKVEGIQGRYFLPLALVAGAAFIGPRTSGSRMASFGAVLAGLFPLVTIVVVVHAVLLRYYL